MNNLIIIGNGFDLAHDLKTSYRHFLNNINKNVRSNPDQYSDILKDDKIDFLRSKQSLRNDPKIFKNLMIQQLTDLVHLSNWSDIEHHYSNLINEAAKLKNKSSESAKKIKNINKEFEQIKQYLKIYLSDEQKEFNKIDAFDYFFSELNNKDTVVLNFNYTNTVSCYLDSYKLIKQINIHGELDNDNNPMIFGFAASDVESKELIDKNEEGYMRNIKKINYMFTNNDKDLKSLMDNTIGFDVVILGHSCGVSDRLILSQIFNHHKANSITPFCYKDREGYLQTIINIDRIIDDYSKNEEKQKSFNKLDNLPQCIPMIQHDSSKDQIDQFKEYLKTHRIFEEFRYATTMNPKQRFKK